jgi:virginiamycin B lyase
VSSQQNRRDAFWFDGENANKVGRITPQGHITDEFTIPTPKSGAHPMTAGTDGNMWFTEVFASRIAAVTMK